MHVPDFKTLIMPAVVQALDEWKQEALKSEGQGGAGQGGLRCACGAAGEGQGARATQGERQALRGLALEAGQGVWGGVRAWAWVGHRACTQDGAGGRVWRGVAHEAGQGWWGYEGEGVGGSLVRCPFVRKTE